MSSSEGNHPTITCIKCSATGIVNFRRVTEFLEDGTELDVIKCSMCGHWLKTRTVLKSRVKNLNRPKDNERIADRAEHNRYAISEDKRARFAAMIRPCSREGCTGQYYDTPRNRYDLCLTCRDLQQKWEHRQRKVANDSPSPFLRNADGKGWIRNPAYPAKVKQ